MFSTGVIYMTSAVNIIYVGTKISLQMIKQTLGLLTFPLVHKDHNILHST